MIKALSISDFCKQHSISRNLFYTLKKQGLAPKMIRAGKRCLISVEAAAEWCKMMENLTSRGV